MWILSQTETNVYVDRKSTKTGILIDIDPFNEYPLHVYQYNSRTQFLKYFLSKTWNYLDYLPFYTVATAIK